jgi:phosphoglycerate dehydrogenase-like enzyme
VDEKRSLGAVVTRVLKVIGIALAVLLAVSVTAALLGHLPFPKEKVEVNDVAIMALPRDVLRHAWIIINPAYHVTKQVMDAMPSLKWIQSTGAGINTGGILMTDWEEIDKRGIIVTTAKFHAPWISETVLGYMLVLGKDFLRHYEGQKKRQNTSRERGTRGIYLGDARALILGTGNIGGAIAKRARLGFTMKTVGVNSDGHAVDHFDETWPLSELDRLLPAADFVVLTLTLTEKTQFIINARNLPLMKKSAFLINISRGDLIVEDDLIRALRDKVIAGAALDVFHHEPLPRDSPLFELEKVLLTPHASCIGMKDPWMHLAERLLANYEHFKRGEYSKMREVANAKRY